MQWLVVIEDSHHGEFIKLNLWVQERILSKERQTHQKLMTFLKYVLKEKMDIMKSQYSILLMTSSLKEELLQIVMDTNIKWPPIGNEFKL